MRRARSLAQTVTGSMTQCFSVDWNNGFTRRSRSSFAPNVHVACVRRPSHCNSRNSCHGSLTPSIALLPSTSPTSSIGAPLPLSACAASSAPPLTLLPLCPLALRKNARVGMEQCVQAEPMNGKVAVSDTLRPYARPPPWTNVYGHRSACVCVSMM